MVPLRYPNCFTPSELSTDYDIRSDIDLKEVMVRFGEMAGIKFSDRILKYNNGDFLALQKSDIEGLTSRVSHMGIIDHADAISIFLQEQKNGFTSSGEKVTQFVNSSFSNNVHAFSKTI